MSNTKKFAGLWVLAIVTMGSSSSIAAEGVGSSEGEQPAKVQREAAAPIMLMRDVLPDQLQTFPKDMPIQRYHIDRHGGRVVEGGVSGATGTLVYQNTLTPAPFFAPGVNVQIADDILIASAGGCSMSFLQVFVTGGGTGTGPGFNATFALMTACPGQGGTVIPGTQMTAMLPNNGGWLVSIDTETMPVQIPDSTWLRVSFSTAAAGWVLGGPAEVGFTGNVFHHPMFPCNTIFGGANPPYAGFQAEIWCAGQITEFYEAYRASEFSGFLDILEANDLWADDIEPISSPGTCEFVRYDSSIAGLMGNFSMKVELYTNDDATTVPLAPVPGTSMTCNGTGGGALLTCSKSVNPAIAIPTPNFWMVYDLITGAQAGPILVADFPEVGFSEDGFSIFGMPMAGQWSPPIWWYGGCPNTDPMGDPVPCGTFQNTVFCAGTPPLGACCDIVSGNENDCTNDTIVTQCNNGRWLIDATCASAPFDPPCGTASCCKTDGSCENLTGQACGAINGLWQPGFFCDTGTQTCPPAACITATNPCTQANNNAGGCSDADCCSIVCGVDPFCCDTAWDPSCVGFANQLCPATPPNNACNAAIAIGDGSFTFDTTLATTDGPLLPAACEQGAGNSLTNDIWYDFTAPLTGNTTVTLCQDTTYDSRIAVYTGCTCPVVNANKLACDDDDCGMVGGPSRMTFPVTQGQCYKLRIGGWEGETGQGMAQVTTTAGISCPNGAVTFVNPPTGVVDARQPHPVNSTVPRQGISTFTVMAPPGAGAACWSVCETASLGGPIAISNVSENAGMYTITLSRPLTPGAVTTLSYNGSQAVSTGTFRFHPGNVNGDSQAAPTDILRIIDCLNGVNQQMNCPWGIYSQDLDHSGQFGPADILRDIDLLNGADAFDPWANTNLPTNAGICP